MQWKSTVLISIKKALPYFSKPVALKCLLWTDSTLATITVNTCHFGFCSPGGVLCGIHWCQSPSAASLAFASRARRSHAEIAPQWRRPGARFNIKTVFPEIGIPINKIARSHDRLVFFLIMGIPIPGCFQSLKRPTGTYNRISNTIRVFVDYAPTSCKCLRITSLITSLYILALMVTIDHLSMSYLND